MRTILIFLLVILFFSPARAGEKIVFQMRDPSGDDFGQGDLAYPSHEVFVAGLFDLRKFSVSKDAENFYFDFYFPVITNPFGAPEGFFHQRIEVYLDLVYPGGKEEIIIGKHSLAAAPNYGWEARLSIAPFGESYLEVVEPQMTLHRQGVKAFKLDGQNIIRVQVDRALLPEMEQSWRYYVLVGSFDGLEAGFWRGFAEDSWGLSGTTPPIIDLLAPRWGLRGQKRQLKEGVLYPVGPGWRGSLPWLKIALLVAVSFGIIFWGIYLWRWPYVRT